MNDTILTIIFILVLLITIFAVIIAINYITTWFDKWNCDSLGGAFRIENDGYIQKTICQVTSSTQTSKCYKNNKEVNCSTFDDYLRNVNPI